MIETLSIVTVVLLTAVLVLQVVLRPRGPDLSPVQAQLDALAAAQDRVERGVREEFALSREAGATQARAGREEFSQALKNFNDSVLKQMTEIAGLQKNQLEAFATRISAISQGTEQRLEQMRADSAEAERLGRQELGTALKAFNDSTVNSLTDMAVLQGEQLKSFAEQLDRLTESNARKLEELKTAIEGKLALLQADNALKLEEMRRTVDEKLQGTLERRLGESFKLVSERLEQVHKGLGEMQSLASGVGDLKKVLTNVKVRGTWGEVQLGALLEQILSPEQFARNVATKRGSNDRVEFAIKLPGRGDLGNEAVWLPIDSKFPKEDYERLVAASEAGDTAGVEEAARQLELGIRNEARQIRDKYLDPPQTTDFGMLFLPTEGLYAEALRRPGLIEFLQREYRVNVAGPTTLGALLNSLQMGFRTLAIQKRSSEVWLVLGAVKTEFGRFGEVIERVQKKLTEASNAMEGAATRTRAIERKLREVQELPAAEAQVLLDDPSTMIVEPVTEEAGST
ncbi:DNA recombination protein RmuC [Verrucomicrobiota bacterium]|nr:DNA recombination protein RmuC [Verrucomicrobiota bacterium]